MKTDCGYLMSQLQYMGGRIFEKILRDSGIDAFTGAQGRILYVLWEHGSLTITKIGKMTSLAKSTLTVMLDMMEKKKLVRRVPDPVNRRQIHVQITEKAKGYKKEYDDISNRMTELSYAGFSDAEMECLEGMLKRIKRNLESYEA